MAVRDARADDLPAMQDIEVAAGRLFDEVGMPEIAGDEPCAIEELSEFLETGLAWVATDERDVPIGYLVAVEIAGSLHIEQVSLLPDHSRRGIGRGLIERAEREANNRSLPAVTLTTFTLVPWNAPYYRRCGFEDIPQEQESDGLRRIRLREAENGLDRWPRTCMRKAVADSGGQFRRDSHG